MTHRSRSELPLLPLTEEQGSRLLLHIQNKEDSSTLTMELGRDLSREVGGSPLLLVGLAGYMMDCHESLAGTLEDMRQSWTKSDNPISSISSKSATYQYERPIHAAFNMSLGRLTTMPISILRIMSMLSPTEISEDLLSVQPEDHSLRIFKPNDKQRHVTI